MVETNADGVGRAQRCYYLLSSVGRASGRKKSKKTEKDKKKKKNRGKTCYNEQATTTEAHNGTAEIRPRGPPTTIFRDNTSRLHVRWYQVNRFYVSYVGNTTTPPPQPVKAICTSRLASFSRPEQERCTIPFV